MHIAVLLAALLVSVLIGYAIGKGAITGKTTQANCIPPQDLQYFLDQANQIQAEYKKCVQDLWALQFTYKMKSGVQANNSVNSS